MLRTLVTQQLTDLFGTFSIENLVSHVPVLKKNNPEGSRARGTRVSTWAGAQRKIVTRKGLFTSVRTACDTSLTSQQVFVRP